MSLGHLEKIHRAIAQALANSPGRLNGEQLRFLRNHLDFTGDKLGLISDNWKYRIERLSSESRKLALVFTLMAVLITVFERTQ